MIVGTIFPDGKIDSCIFFACFYSGQRVHCLSTGNYLSFRRFDFNNFSLVMASTAILFNPFYLENLSAIENLSIHHQSQRSWTPTHPLCRQRIFVSKVGSIGHFLLGYPLLQTLFSSTEFEY